MKQKTEKWPTVDQALHSLRRAMGNEARQSIAEGVLQYLSRRPMIANARIEGCTIVAEKEGITVRPTAKSGRAPGKGNRRPRSAASRAKQAAAMRKVWYEKRKAARRGKA